MTSRRVPDCFLSLLISVAVTLLASGASLAAGLHSPWHEGYQARTRLLAGRADDGGGARLMAFVEIALPEGWKTYWRTPGDAGGLPPTFDWSKSSNLAEAKVLYPAPELMRDRSGNTIGYKGGVIYPVEIAPKDPGRAIGLALAFHFGICKDICVPVDAELALDVPANAQDAAPAQAIDALAQVPRAAEARRDGDPVLERVEVQLDGATPRVVIEARFPGSPGRADIFLETPDGSYFPLPVRSQDNGDGRLTFAAPLDKDVDLAALSGKTITATLVGDGGASVATFPLQ